MLDNQHGTAFTDMPFFNETFIRNNKIKKLTGKYSLKKPGDPMKTTDYKYVFNFDSLGHLISTFQTRNENGIKDTIINIYKYAADNRLSVHWKNDAHGYTSRHYEYDSLGRIISEETHRDILDKNGIVKQSIILNKETMSYDQSTNQVKKIIYNSYNLPYMEVYHNYNNDGYLLEKEEYLKMAATSVKYKYEYNEKGYISNLKTSSSFDGKVDEEWRFQYDKFGDLYEKHIYKNGVHTTDIQIIYNLDTRLLSSVLTRDVKTNYIYILRFQNVEFY